MANLLNSEGNFGSHYYHAGKQVLNELAAARDVATSHVTQWILGSMPSFGGDGDIAAADQPSLNRVVTDIKAAYPNINMRMRNYSEGVNAEHRALPTWFEEFEGAFLPGLVWWQKVHLRKFVGFYNSDWIGGKVLSTFPQFSWFLFPMQMTLMYGLPTMASADTTPIRSSGVGGFTFSCVGNDMQKGLEWFQQTNGRGTFTPFDLFLARNNLSMQAMLMASSDSPCVGVNHGSFVPIRNTYSQEYRAPAAVLAAVSGFSTAQALIPFWFYTFRFKKSDTHRDKFQWAQNQKMREMTGGECVDIERFLDQYGSALKDDPSDPRNDWLVAIKWTKFRGCPSHFTADWCIPFGPWIDGTEERYE